MTEIQATPNTLRILREFMLDPARELSGHDIWNRTKIWAGYSYQIIWRLEKAGWLTSRWEELDPASEPRPRRRFYRLTAEGIAGAGAALEAEAPPRWFEWWRPAFAALALFMVLFAATVVVSQPSDAASWLKAIADCAIIYGCAYVIVEITTGQWRI
jgi:DNA-binding PadR family transcriptional regulator